MINQSIASIQQTVDKVIQNKIKEIEKTAQVQAKGKVTLIRNDIFVAYGSFVRNYISNYFDKTYGANNYNETSLMDSLTFFKTGGFLPDFSYTTNTFLWESDINADINKFNENSIYESKYVGFNDDNLNEVDTLDSIDEDEKLGNYYEDYSSIKSQGKEKFSYYNRLNRQGAFASLSEVYQKAHTEANIAFEKKLYGEIIPVMYKKYGIKIGK